MHLAATLDTMRRQFGDWAGNEARLPHSIYLAELAVAHGRRSPYREGEVITKTEADEKRSLSRWLGNRHQQARTHDYREIFRRAVRGLGSSFDTSL